MASEYRIFLIAGEPSGDLLGAQLMKALKILSPVPVVFQGIGGHLMQNEGMASLFSSDDLALMGITEGLTKAFSIWKKLKYVKKYLKNNPPDILLTIDFPGFNFRLGQSLKNRSYPHVHYVAPTVWAWREERAKKIARFLDHLLVLFPFEPPYFEKEGLKTTFVGHPIMEMGFNHGNGEGFKARYHIDPDVHILCALPGSRMQEVTRHLPIFKKTIQGLADRGIELHTLIPTVPGVHNFIEDSVRTWPVPVTLVPSPDEKKDAYHAATIALAASGTVALELAASHLPMIITYKLSALSAFIARRLIKVPYVCMINILLKKLVVPEFLQEKCTPGYLIPALEKMLHNKSIRDRQIAQSTQALQLLHVQKKIPSANAAEVILKILSTQKEA